MKEFGFRDILSLKESLGFLAASTADLLTQTLVPLALLLYPGLMVGAEVLSSAFGPSELVLTPFELYDVADFSSIDSVVLWRLS